MATKPKTITGPADKTYIMDLSGGRMRRITVPADWKVTFGPLVPHRPGEKNYDHQKTFALRFYEGKDAQRAIFTDVLSFRDESLKVEERVTKVKQQVMNKNGPTGAVGTVVEARITEWRDPMAPETPTDEAFLQLGKPTKDF